MNIDLVGGGYGHEAPIQELLAQARETLAALEALNAILCPLSGSATNRVPKILTKAEAKVLADLLRCVGEDATADMVVDLQAEEHPLDFNPAQTIHGADATVTSYLSPEDGATIVEIDIPDGIEMRVYVNDGEVEVDR